MRLTTFFGLPSSIPFVDIDVDKDIPRFLDPQRIARAAANGDLIAQAADSTIRRFSTQLCQRLTSSSLSERQLGLNMLDNLNEPRETRLGMTRTGYNGHGVHTHFREEIDKAITQDLRALVTVGVFNWLGALPLFVEGFAADRMSDMTTGIIRGHLIDYTKEMIRRYPQFTRKRHRLEQHTMEVWDFSTHQWISRTVDLPTAGGHPILLVPKIWAGKDIELRGQRYYNCQALDYIQKKLVGSNPKAGKVAKRTLKSSYPDVYLVNRNTTLEAYEQGVNLLLKFIDYVDSWDAKSEAA